MAKILLHLSIGLLFSLSTAQPIYFPPVNGNTWETTTPESLGYCQEQIDLLYNYLETNNTKAFILLKDGKIVLEKYFGTHTQNTLWKWASAGKTITSFMVGIAQQEGHLQITDTTSTYLGESWTSCTPAQEEKITIRNQLTMTSGLDDDVADLYCTLPSCLIYRVDAGTRWAYHNGPYTMLDKVIENATGMTLNAYATEKLKAPTGMTGTFFPVGYNNVFFSNARSMARFGLLILNDGNWDGNQIMTDANYFNEMINTSQAINKSYGYLWWLNGKESFMVPGSQLIFPGSFFPNAPGDTVAAMGSGGQFLNIVPSENLVWLRMGDDPSDLPVPALLNNSIWAYVNDLVCGLSVSDPASGNTTINLTPNPVDEYVQVTATQPLSKIDFFSSTGQKIKTQEISGYEATLIVKELPVGLYFIKCYSLDGSISTKKILKN